MADSEALVEDVRSLECGDRVPSAAAAPGPRLSPLTNARMLQERLNSWRAEWTTNQKRRQRGPPAAAALGCSCRRTPKACSDCLALILLLGFASVSAHAQVNRSAE